MQALVSDLDTFWKPDCSILWTPGSGPILLWKLASVKYWTPGSKKVFNVGTQIQTNCTRVPHIFFAFEISIRHILDAGLQLMVCPVEDWPK